MGLVATAIIIGSGGIIGSQAHASRKASKKADNAARDAEERNRKLEAEAISRSQKEESDSAEIQTRDKARNRQKARAKAASGRRKTFITGSLGIQDRETIATGGKRVTGE